MHIDPSIQVVQIVTQKPETADDPPDWEHLPLADLCDAIEARYHRSLRRQLAELVALGDKVVRAHGGRHPELEDVQHVMVILEDELVRHMMKEEQVLFPMIRRTLSAPLPPIGVMRHEHEVACEALATLRERTRGYAVPEDGCASYRAYYEGLARLEVELYEHIHVENDILFPRAAGPEER